MPILNQLLQENVLQILAESEQHSLTASEIFSTLNTESTYSLQPEQYAIFLHNIRDLIQKNLIVNQRELNTFEKYDFLISISPIGLAYLEPNSGIQIDNTITVKLDNQTLQTLVNFHIDRSDVSEAEKSNLKGLFSKIGDATIGKLTEKALDVAFSQNPQVMIQFLQQLPS